MNKDVGVSPTYFMHYRSRNARGAPLPTGGATVAIRPLGGNIIRVAIAKCHPKDVFNKWLGREIASGRLEARERDAGSGKNVYDLISRYPSDTPVKDVVADMLSQTFEVMGLE